jgi:hypothetical protein
LFEGNAGGVNVVVSVVLSERKCQISLRNLQGFYFLLFQNIMCLQGATCFAEMPKNCGWEPCRPVTKCIGKFGNFALNYASKSFELIKII